MPLWHLISINMRLLAFKTGFNEFLRCYNFNKYADKIS
jgi:hypothetical protein